MPDGDRREPVQGRVGEYEFDREEGRVRVNLQGSVYGASIEDFEPVMARVIDILRERDGVERVVLAQERDYEYGYEQIRLLTEVADLIERLQRTPEITQPDDYLQQNCQRMVPEAQSFVQDLLVDDLRRDPIGAFVKVRRKIEETKVKVRNAPDRVADCYEHWLEHTLRPLRDRMEGLELITRVEDELAGYHVGDRELYREIFHPTIRPNFMLTRYMKNLPENAREVARYTVEAVDTEVQVLRQEEAARPHYHVTPPEFSLRDEEYEVLDIARRYMSEHRPGEEEMAEGGRVREIFSNIGEDMISNVADQQGVTLSPEKLDQLTSILVRYTAGLGVLEVLLADKQLQDIYVNAPVGTSPIYVIHGEYGECGTNLIPTQDDVESWATRFRLMSGRPLDEANPVLDTSAEVPGGRARVAIVTQNLSPDGLAYAFRRHRDKPWTYPLFMDNEYINGIAAGVLSFLIDGGRTMLISGTRSAGKTSLLGASLLELMKSTRIVSVEDTLELPLPALQEIGYNIERLKSRSVITQVESEMPAEEAIRTSLRLGDSSLIVGEVRSTEAKALYEAMRIGAVANFVGGTIHGEDAYAVFDRVVNDLGVPATSFKATDIIVSANRLQSPSGLDRVRRVTGVTEVRKEWTEDPQEEGAFVDLLRYDAEEDELVPTETLLNGESVIMNRIANNVREWKNDWDAVWENIQLRKRIHERIVELGREHDERLMEARFMSAANESFHTISREVQDELGALDADEIYERWDRWAQDNMAEIIAAEER